jgi:hypothetical protein
MPAELMVIKALARQRKRSSIDFSGSFRSSPSAVCFRNPKPVSAARRPYGFQAVGIPFPILGDLTKFVTLAAEASRGGRVPFKVVTIFYHYV